MHGSPYREAAPSNNCTNYIDTAFLRRTQNSRIISKIPLHKEFTMIK